MVNNLGPYTLNTIVTGDARELAKAIPDNSIDLIFTDPIYQNIDDYTWLAETAVRVLKPDSACLVYSSIGMLDNCIEALKTNLNYLWVSATYYPGMFRHCGLVMSQYSPCIYTGKGSPKVYTKISDVHIQASRESHIKYINNGASWAKDQKPIRYMLQSLTQPGAIVFDPFTGGGTVPAVCKMLGRDYLAFEIDAPTAALARKRVEMTQAPLFVLAPEQLPLLQELA